MLTYFDILIALAVAGLAWLAWDQLRAREAANRAIRAACTSEGFLFLDDTVALRSIRPARDHAGRLRLQRVYGFDYSDSGVDRRSGSVTLAGTDVLAIAIASARPTPGATLH